jgi:pSer/pThr/pTyr-binding forkhead associated (FHA) protein
MTRLIVLQKNGSARQVNVSGTPFVIGRADSCDLVLENLLVSRTHAVLESVAERIVLRDLGSHNGTFLNGERIEAAALRNGDEIKVGDAQMRFLAQGPAIGDIDLLRLVTVPGRLTDLELQRLGLKG